MYNNEVFEGFLNICFDMKLSQIKTAVMYVAKFLALNLQLEPPECNLGDDPEQVLIEEFLAF